MSGVSYFRGLVFAMAGFAAVWQGPLARAASPLAALAPFRRVEADPAKTYALKEANGPWMILCCTFAGPSAERDAQKLVLELRQQLKLTAFTHAQHYDFTKTEIGLGVDKFGQPKRMKNLQAVEYNEIAVLVGDFNAIDDPKLQKTLEQLKYAQPECLKTGAATASTKRYRLLREWQKAVTWNKEEKAKGPMGKAFATRNPLLPQEFFAPRGIDPLVKEMNRDVEHSLLKCPGKYTVQIARFTGSVVIDQRRVRELEQQGGQVSDRLEQAALKAHQLVESLRRRKIEAYEFHDREASIVTVGSFDSVGEPRADGKTEINPAVHKIMEQFGAQKVALPGGNSTGLQPRQVDGITLDVQPLPVLVPKESIASAYAQGAAR